MSFLIDTDTCSAHLRRNHAVFQRFLQHGGQLHVSAITAGELFTWALRAGSSPKRLQSLLDLLTDVAVLDTTLDIARKLGELRAALLDQGRPTADLDLVIAATALVHGLTLVTHNVSDFAHVPGLKVTDWLAS